MAIGAMLVVILIYDQLMFRPLVAWADRFRIGETNEPSEEQPESWALDRLPPLASFLDMMAAPFDADDALVLSLAAAAISAYAPPCAMSTAVSATLVWYAASGSNWASMPAWRIYAFAHDSDTWAGTIMLTRLSGWVS